MSLHLKLKTETDFAHRRLEKALDLMRPDLSLDEYIRILKAFYGFYFPLEKLLKKNNDKTKWLEQDLKYFGVDVHSLPLCQNLPFQKNDSYLFGVHYVLKGSNLGAMVLTKHFEKLLRLSSDSGLKYFTGPGENTVPEWRSFLSELQTFSESKYCHDEHVIAGANDTFSLLYEWLINYK